jgi:undecaprenyl-diphosphatase
LPPVAPSPPRRVRTTEAVAGGIAVAGAAALLQAVRTHGHNLAIDSVPLEWAAAAHSPALTALMRCASRMVDPMVVTPITLLAMLAGVGRRSPRDVPWLAPVAVIGGGVVILTLKLLLRRARPTAFAHLMRTRGFSLPSGHAFMAMCLYGLLAHHGLRWLRARRPDDRVGAALLLAMAATIVLLVGISRVYLGVHYPTDVIAGYVLALLWLWLLAAINDRQNPVLD